MSRARPGPDVPITPSRVACAGWLGVAGLLLIFPGCDDPSPYAQQRLRMREERLSHTAQTFVKSEKDRPAMLARDAAFIPADIKLHATRLRAASEWFVNWQKRDIDRFRERMPVYRDETERILRGHPERIENNAITLFF